MGNTNTFVISNKEATSKCFSHFRGMRRRRERLDFFINTEDGEEVGAHLTVLSAFFPALEKHLKANGDVHVGWRRVVNAAVDFAYGGIEEISPNCAIRLYLLAHNLQSAALVEGCTKWLCDKIEEVNVSELWSAANATENEVLIVKCAPQVAMGWEMFMASRQMQVNTEIIGMMNLLGCPEMALVSGTSKVKALLTWRTSSRDDEDRSTRTDAFKNFIPPLRIQNGRELLRDLDVENVDIPTEWREWLAEARGDTGRLSAFKEEKGDDGSSNTTVWIFNEECSQVETERKLPDRKCGCVVSFQKKLAFVGGWEVENSCISSRIELMDPSTGRLSSALPNMTKARFEPACVATEKEIFVFSDWRAYCPGAFSSEVYEAASERWSPLPQMSEDRLYCAVVSIPGYGVLVIGGVGRNEELLRSTELLMLSSGGDEKWQWRQFPPMNEEHGAPPRAVYFQGRVYVVGWKEKLDSMEMLDVTGRQWTSLSSFGATSDEPLRVHSMATVGNRLFVNEYDTLYSTELESDPKRQHQNLRQLKEVEKVEIGWRKLTTVHLKT